MILLREATVAMAHKAGTAMVPRTATTEARAAMAIKEITAHLHKVAA